MRSIVSDHPNSPSLALGRRRCRAKAISDYDAAGPEQLSLMADEVIAFAEYNFRKMNFPKK